MLPSKKVAVEKSFEAQKYRTFLCKEGSNTPLMGLVCCKCNRRRKAEVTRLLLFSSVFSVREFKERRTAAEEISEIEKTSVKRSADCWISEIKSHRCVKRRQ